MHFLCSVFAALIPFMILAASASAGESEDPKTTQQKQSFEAQIVKTVRLNYLLFLPEGYNDDNEKEWPLILFLHGMGERGKQIKGAHRGRCRGHRREDGPTPPARLR